MNKEQISPLVSVIVPIYNVAQYLTQCLESIRNQSYTNIEVILVCDGLDKDIEICQSFVKKDERFRLLTNIQKGLGGARNAGINVAKGEYILFVDGDDYITNDCILKLTTSILEKNCDVLIGQVVIFPEDSMSAICVRECDKIFNWFGSPCIETTQVSEDNIEDVYGKVNCTVWNRFFSTHFLRKNDLFFIDKNCLHEDHGFWLKVLSSFPIISSISDQTYYYRVKNQRNAYSAISMRESLTDALLFVKKAKNCTVYHLIKTEIYKTFFHPICKFIWLRNERSLRLLFIPIFKMKKYPRKNKQILKLLAIQLWKRSYKCIQF